ncbi:MAG: MFS transporter [Dysgonomonas sp.]
MENLYSDIDCIYGWNIPGLLDKIASSTGISVSLAGQLVTIYALSNAIGTPIFMLIASKLKEKSQIIISLIMLVVGAIVMIIAQGFFMMVVSRIITGIGAGVYSVAAYGLAVKLVAPEKQGSAILTVAMGVSSSLVFGVPLGRLISGIHGWQTIFWVIGTFSFAAIFIVMKIIPNSETMNTEQEIKENHKDESRFAVLNNPRIAITLMVTLLMFIGFSIVDTYIAPYLRESMPSMIPNISIILMFLGVGSLIGSKLGGFLADRVGVVKTITGALKFQAVFLFISTFVSKYIVFGIIVLMLWDISCWIFGPIQNLNVVSLAPSLSSIALSLNSTFVQIGIAIGAGIGGFVVKNWSILSITWISGLSVLIGLGFLWISLVMASEKKNVQESYE